MCRSAFTFKAYMNQANLYTYNTYTHADSLEPKQEKGFFPFISLVVAIRHKCHPFFASSLLVHTRICTHQHARTAHTYTLV